MQRAVDRGRFSCRGRLKEGAFRAKGGVKRTPFTQIAMRRGRFSCRRRLKEDAFYTESG